jgi:hypothetical protein
LAVPPQKRAATGRGGSNSRCLESAKVLFFGVNIGNVRSAHDFTPRVVSECQTVRSPKAGFADVNDVLVEIDDRMVVAVGTLDRADADVIVRDMVWPTPALFKTICFFTLSIIVLLLCWRAFARGLNVVGL